MSLRPLPLASAPSKAKIKHSTRGRWRAAILIAIHVVVAIRVAHYNATGQTITPVEPSEAMQTLENGIVNAGFVFFLLAIFSTLIFGRFFCGWACHIVALQDLCGALLKKIGLQPKPFRSRLLVFVPILAALYMFVWPQFLRLFEGRPMPPIVYHFKTDDFWVTFPNVWVSLLTFAVCGFLAVILLGNKGFCTYGCPYGAAFYAADRVARGKIRVTDACNGCGHCTAVCSSNVRVHEEVKLHKMVVDPACMKCLDCVSTCPNNALYYGFGPGAGKLRPARKYDFSWPEEILMAVAFLVSLYAVRGLYDLFPFLLSLGWASIFAFLTLTAWRCISKPQVRVQHLQLKAKNRLSAGGGLWVALIAALWVLTLHSAWVQFNANQAGARLALAQAGYEGRAKLSPAELDAVARSAYEGYAAVSRMALVPVAGWELRKGSLQEYLGDPAKAEQHWIRAIEIDGALVTPRQRLYDLYEQQARWREAEAMARWLRERHPLRPDPAKRLGIALMNQQRWEVAEPELAFALKALPDDPALLNAMGMTLANRGELVSAEQNLARAVALAPSSGRIGVNYALVIAEQGRVAEALDVLDRVVLLSNAPLEAFRFRTQMALRIGDAARAWDSAQKLKVPAANLPADAQLWATSAVAAKAKIDPGMLEFSALDQYFYAAWLKTQGKSAESQSVLKRLQAAGYRFPEL